MLRVQRFAMSICGLAIGAMVLLSASSAFGDSFGSWGSSGGSSGGSWGGRPGLFGGGSRGGPIRNLFGRIHDRLHGGFASSGGWGSSGGSWGSSGGYVVSRGSSGGSWGSSGGGSWGSSGGSSGYTHVYSGYSNWATSPGMGSDYIQSRPDYLDRIQPSNPAGETPPPPPQPSDDGGAFWQLQEADGVFVLQVHVPDDAIVYVNGKRTRSTGPIRKYVARRLAYDQEYQIEVTAVVDRGGRQLVRSETISSRAGEERDVQISFDNTLPPPATSVTVHVPAEAKVYLAGNPTNQTGETRVFTTDALPAGATWGDYRVVAEIERDGQVVTLEKTLDVAAGGTYELSFDFSTAETRVAAR